jgi:hypothetical protein
MMASGTAYQWFQAYESLRGQVLGSPGRVHHDHGLSLFITRGMAAWLAALKTLSILKRASCQTIPGENSENPAPGLGTRGDLTVIVADMIAAYQ